MHQHQPDREEVLDAVNKASIYRWTNPLPGEDIQRAQGLTASDVAEHIYTNHHGRMVNNAYGSRAALLRKGVNVSRVKRLLSDLAEDGEILEAPGDHWSIARQHGASKVATYYFGKEAANLALEKATALAQKKREKVAQETAEKVVLTRYADEVKKEWENLLAEGGVRQGGALVVKWEPAKHDAVWLATVLREEAERKAARRRERPSLIRLSAVLGACCLVIALLPNAFGL